VCNGCNGVSLGDHGVPEGDRIPSLESHGKALEQEIGFPGVFCDCSDASADLLCLVIIIIFIMARCTENAKKCKVVPLVLSLAKLFSRLFLDSPQRQPRGKTFFYIFLK